MRKWTGGHYRLQQSRSTYFTACRTEGKTAKTLRGYNEKLGRFLRWFDGPLGDLSLATAREFVAELQDTEKRQGREQMPNTGAKISALTVANHVRVLKAFSSWLYEEGYTPENLLVRLALPKAPRKVIEVLDEEEITRLLAAIDPSRDLGPRDLAILVLFLDTGLRLSELMSLRLADVHLEGQWLR